MIDLTVKTLDSQNHAFSLNDDITVRQFKEHIADTVNIAADLQRLIYCGRVLQNEKLLSEYDVNGKVIHLVQRAPPSSNARNTGTNQGQSQNNGTSSEWQSTPRVLYRHTQYHDDPLYIGSFSIPADDAENVEWPTVQVGNTLVVNHVVLIQRMLNEVNEIIDRLEDPSVASSGSTSTENNSSSSTQSTTASTAESGGAWSTVAPTAEMNIPTSRTNDSTASIPTTESTDVNIESSQQQLRDETITEHSPPASNPATLTESNNTAITNDTPLPYEFVELLEMLLTTQDRFGSYVRNRFISNNGSTSRQLSNDENQQIIDGITECFHFLSHAQHALSNLTINMQQPPPRTLRCRPMIIQPSAILQTRMPIQVEAHISVHGQNENNADGDGNSANIPRTLSGTTQTTTSSMNETPMSTGTDPQPQSTPESSRDTAQQQHPQPQQQQQQSHSQTPFGTVFNFPNNVEVMLESAPQARRVWSFSTGDNNGTTNNNNNNVANNNNGNTTSGSNVGGSGGTGNNFQRDAASSPDIIRNILQVLTGYMSQSGFAPTSVPSVTTSSVPTTNLSTNTVTPIGCIRHHTPAGSSESTGNSGQNSQTRGNTETHPTTSTQTRTTSRTHVFHQHAQALGVGVGFAHNMDFDPFLPCNSHHIRRGNSSTSASSSATAATGAMTNIAASTQTGGQNNTSTATHPLTQTRTSVTSTHPRVATITGVQIVDNIFDNTSLAESIANFERISSSLEGGIPFSRVLSNRGTNLFPDSNPQIAGMIRIIFNVLGNIPIHLWFRLVRSDLSPLTNELIQTLRTRMRDYIGEISNTRIPNVIANILCNELKSGLERTFDGESAVDENGRAIDIYATVNKMLKQFIVNFGTAIYNDEINVENIVQIIRDFGRDLSAVLRYSLRGGQLGLERIISRYASEMSRGTHERFRVWILGTVAHWFFNYTRNVARIENSKIQEFLVYKTDVNEIATTSSETTNAKPEPTSEPMEVDSETNSHPPTHNSWMDEDEIIPATFPGDDSLMSNWIPIMAHDAVAQRRILSLSGNEVTTMSDAYLSTMPSKRRKLVEQRKAPLMVNQSSNRSAIPSSMERLIRDSVGRAGFEEVDGAVAAIVADPTVRRAFGQAIRESLNPQRYQTQDFPDASRFPNATKFFTNPNRPAKQ